MTDIPRTIRHILVAMMRRFWVGFYAFAFALFVGIALVLSGLCVWWFAKHRDIPWIGLVLIPVWLYLARETRDLLRREMRSGETEGA